MQKGKEDMRSIFKYAHGVSGGGGSEKRDLLQRVRERRRHLITQWLKQPSIDYIVWYIRVRGTWREGGR